MNDDSTLTSISRLANEEHDLFRMESSGEATEVDRIRLGEVEVLLDQCWDLLRQRRARRTAGLDPDDAAVRDERTVEGYWQ
jgi:hypothetical protein